MNWKNLTREEALRLRKLIEKASDSLSDGEALEGILLAEHWKPDMDYAVGKRLSYNDKLWKVLQAHHSLAIYPPSIDTASLYAEVEQPGQGDDITNPIPYNNNMELIEGKYYIQNGITYLCIRSSGIPVYNDLADLVGNYVEVV